MLESGFLAQLARLKIGDGRVDAVFHDAPFGVYLDSPTDGAVYANPALLNTFALSWPEFAGFGWARRVADADRERLTQRVAEFELTRGTIDVEYRIETPTGQRWVHAHVTAIVDDDDQHVGSVGLVTDVTASHASRASAADRQRIEAVGRLSARVAHDFNNSLSAMMLIADSLDAEPLSTPARKLHDVLKTSIRQAAQVTAQLLTLARPQALTARVCDANAAVLGLEELLTSAAGERITLQFDLALEPCFVPLEASQISQILLNLVTNSRDAMIDGGTIKIECAAEERAWVLAVVDAGSGIASDILESVTQPFFTTKELGRGTGLGLSIIRDLVEMADGEFTLESTVGVGTAITIRLPRTHPAAGAVLGPLPHQELAPRHVILLEDNDAIRQALGYALAIRGHHVRVARTLAEARALLDEEGPLDLFITDALVPDGNGIDLAVELRGARPDLAVIIASGFPGTPTVVPELDDTKVLFLKKPFDHARLLDAMHDVCTAGQ